MRRDAPELGSIVHVVKRGARGLEIVRDDQDRRRFVDSLFYLNDHFVDENWRQSTRNLPPFERPSYWPERTPLTHILAWTLMPNHFHLLLHEVTEGGIARFMQRFCLSISAAFNAKYRETGSIFQGPYRSKTIESDDHLRYLALYIQLKNVLELYPQGLRKALTEFDMSWEWAGKYPYSSLQSYVTENNSPLIDDALLADMFPDRNIFKKEGRAMLAGHIAHHEEDYVALDLESW